MSIPLEQGPGLVGQLQVGDHVDVYAGFLVLTSAGRSVPVTKLLVPNATVLKPGSTTSGGLVGGSGSATQPSDVVLKVNVADAAKIAFSSANGTLWLALRSGNAVTPSASQQTIDSILFGSKPIPAGAVG